MLSDGFTWYFGILIKDPHDPSQLWTCCRSEAFNLTLDWVLEPLDPENQEASEFLDQVLLIVEAMLTWVGLTTTLGFECSTHSTDVHREVESPKHGVQKNEA